MNKIKFIKNTEKELCVKIVAGEAEGEVNKVTLDFEQMCFKPDTETLAPSDDEANRFQLIDEAFPVSATLITAQPVRSESLIVITGL